jgi:chromosomal replication initiation ATPase DnaA
MSEQTEIVTRGALIKRAIAEVARDHGVTFDDIVSERRDKFIVSARTAAIKKVRASFSNLSLTQIGRVFNRDHTTILYNLRKPDVAP